MSHNQTRADRSDGQLRRPGRSGGGSGHHRGSSSAAWKAASGSGRSGAPPVPAASLAAIPDASNPQPSVATSRSFKKPGNGQGVQQQDGGGSQVAASVPARSVQNGLHPPPASGVPDSLSLSSPAAGIVPKTSKPIPRPPPSQSHSGGSDSAPPKTPMKGDAANPFPLQFGSISPGFMNGMKIPARTSSAPPNLDEQKRDQAQHGHSMALPSTSIPVVPKQQQPQMQHNQTQLPKKEGAVPSQPKIADTQPSLPSKREPNIPASSATVVHQSSAIPLPAISMPLYQNPHVQMQFGGASPQMQSQNAGAGSLQMQMLPLTVGAQQIQPPVFFPALPHTLQSQGIMHQTHGLNFPPQMGHQLPPQIGNLGMGIGTQYTQQQAGALGGQRKTSVKITDPKTREELRLDKRNDLSTDSSIQKPQVGMQHQSQPPPTFTPGHQVTYYQGMQPNTFNPSQMYISSSLPLPSMQMTGNSQPPRFSYSQTGPIPMIPTASISKSGAPSITDSAHLRHPHDGHSIPISAPSASVRVTVKPPPDHLSSRRSGTPASVASIPKDELNKMVKLPDNDVISHNVKGNEASGQQPISNASIERNHTPSYLDVSIQRTKPTVAVEISESKTSVIDDRNETMKETGPLKDAEKRIGQMDIGLTQQQIQTASLDSVASPKLHTIRSPRNISSDVIPELELKVSSTNQDILEAGEKPASLEMSSPAVVEGTSCDSRSCEKKDDSFINVTQCHASEVNEMVDVSVLSRNVKESEASCQQPIRTTSFDRNNALSCLDVSIQRTKPAVAVEISDSKTSVTDDRNETIEESGLMNNLEKRMSQEDIGPTQQQIQTAPLDSILSPKLHTIRSAKDTVSDVIPELEKQGSFADPDSLEKVEKPVSLEETSSSPVEEGTSSDAISCEIKEDISVKVTQSHSSVVSGVIDKPMEVIKSKTTIGKRKKKKEMLSKADAEGMNSDLYMAYKGTNEKQENNNTIASMESSVTVAEQVQDGDTKELDITCIDDAEQGRGELDDWEDVVEVSSPKLSDNLVQSESDKSLTNESESGLMSKRYSRDFLLTFSGQCSELPAGFDIGSDIANVLITAQIGSSRIMGRDQYAGSARIIDRPSSASRVDRRSGNTLEDDKWSKVQTASAYIREIRPDLRSGQGINQGVLRNPRGQSNQYAGGILSSSLQSSGMQGGPAKSNMEADRWARGTGIQRGLIPPPPAQVMHKAEKKYVVGKVSDEEESKQRQLKAILNKLTPQNFDRLFEQVKEVNIDNVVTLTGVISQIFDKALMEPTFCEMYANFCVHLASALPDFTEENEKITFRRLLLNKCQEEFERGEREQAEAEKIEEEGEVKQTVEQREEKKVKARRRMLGNIRLIGELYKKKMLTERIMHECIQKLLGQCQDPDEEDIEALCKLMSTIGEVIDQPRAKEHMDAYFEMMSKLSSNQKLSSRLRFMLKDVIELRLNRWQQRRKIEGPKKIEEVHRDAAQERQAQASRSSRGPVINPSARRGPPVDYGSHGPTALSASGQGSQQMGSLRFPHSGRGLSAQDVRMEDRHLSESRTPSVPLPQRSINNDSITLGPQGGLAKGMSIRGHLTSEEPRRAILGPNISSSREELIHRNPVDKFALSSSERPVFSERHTYSSNRDIRNLDNSSDRSLSATSTATPITRASGHQSTTSGANPLSEERLREKSISAIREYYSAKDEREVALCIKELNSPNFSSSIVSLWVTDSFERKDIEREQLTHLLINLSRSPHLLFSQTHLVQGFESVLSSLEDAVNDAPKATEFLGRMLAKVILENVIPFRDIGRLIKEGGEEPGRLLEIGLAADVLASILEIIKAEKGDSALKEMERSNLRFEDFRPPLPMMSKKLEAFL